MSLACRINAAPQPGLRYGKAQDEREACRRRDVRLLQGGSAPLKELPQMLYLQHVDMLGALHQ